MLGIGLLMSGPVYAHQRSESFSRWHYGDHVLTLNFTVSAREVTRLLTPQVQGSLDWLLADYLASHVEIQSADSDCRLTRRFQPQASRPGYLQAGAAWQCRTFPRAIEISAFFDLAAEHTHFATLEQTTGTKQQLLTDTNIIWLLGPGGPDVQTGSTFTAYVVHGIRHIATGFDHLVFLLALLLICRRGTEIIWAITGFTLGHSLTLTLAALELVQADVAGMEALIGLTIALVAVERSVVYTRSPTTIALVSAAFLLGMALITGLLNARLEPVTLGGLALFAFCYLLMAHELGRRGGFRILITAIFGLIHGFGFAGAFLASGIGQGSLLKPLAGFNIGVELGQLTLIAVFLSAGVLVRSKQTAVPLAELSTAVVFGLGVFWFVQRSFI